MSPAATAPSIASAELAGSDLIWRTAPSAQVRVDASHAMWSDPEAHGLPVPIAGLAVLTNVDQSLHASELQAAMQITLNDSPIPGLAAEDIMWIEYLPNESSGSWVHDPSRMLFLHDPDVTVVFGGTEVPQLVAWFEALWFSAPHGCDWQDDSWDVDKDGLVDAGQVLAALKCSDLKSLGSPPHWVLDQDDMRARVQDEIRNYSLYCLEEAPGGDGCLEEAETFAIEEALGRITGMTQGEGAGPALQPFRDRFQSIHGEVVRPAAFAAHAWDATHLLAFGVAAALQQGDAEVPDAQSIAKGIRLLQNGTAFSLSDDPALIAAALTTLLIDGSINLAGASGGLDFNSAGEPWSGAGHRWRPMATPGSFLLSPILDDAGNPVAP